MKKLINKLISRKLICVLLLMMALIAVIFITVRMFPKVSLAKEEKQNKQMQISSVEGERLELKNITSRNSDETRSQKKQEEQEESNVKTENEKEDTTNYVSIEDVKISKDMDLTIRTGLSRDDFIKLISGLKYDTSGFFEENAGMIYDLCEKYSINEIFFCGLISAESGWNIASNHRKTHNYISLMSNGKLIQYSSDEEGLETATQKLHNNYLTPGGRFYHGKTLAGVKTNFCTSATWVDLVYGRMEQII